MRGEKKPYNLQLGFYSYVLDREGWNVTNGLYFSLLKQEKQWLKGAKDGDGFFRQNAQTMETWLKRWQSLATQGQFPAEPDDNNCRNCSLRGLCRARFFSWGE